MTRTGCLRRHGESRDLYLLWRGADALVDESDTSKALRRTRVSAAPDLDLAGSVGRRVTVRGEVRGWDLRANSDVLVVDAVVAVGPACQVSPPGET